MSVIFILHCDFEILVPQWLNNKLGSLWWLRSLTDWLRGEADT